MAAGDNTDLFVMFRAKGEAVPVLGESRSNLDVDDRTPGNLLEGFRIGHFFELDKFTFGVGVEPEDDEKTEDQAGKDPKGKGAKGKDAKGKGGKPARMHRDGQAARSTLGQFRRWREGTLGNSKYPVQLQDISIGRSIDNSSISLLRHIGRRTYFESVSLIKRRPTGGNAAGEVYLRFDFNGVLITGIDWTNDDEVVETCTFICRAVVFRYKPQLPDGTLGGAIQMAWSARADEA